MEHASLTRLLTGTLMAAVLVGGSVFAARNGGLLPGLAGSDTRQTAATGPAGEGAGRGLAALTSGDPHESTAVSPPSPGRSPAAGGTSSGPTAGVFPLPLPPRDTITVTAINGSGSFPRAGMTYALLPESNMTMEDLGTLVGRGALKLSRSGGPSRCAPLNGTTINIFRWRNEYWAHNGLEGAQPVYCTWELMRVSGPMWPVPRVTSLAPDPVPAGVALTIRGSNFGSRPPAGSVALVRTTATSAGPVYTAPVLSWNSGAIRVLVPATLPAGAYDAVVFQGSVAGYAVNAPLRVLPAASGYIYSCVWYSHRVGLRHVVNVTVEGLTDARLTGTCSDFLTNDPYYRKLNGHTLNVWLAPREFPGRYVVHNGMQGPQAVYGTWTFPMLMPPVR